MTAKRKAPTARTATRQTKAAKVASKSFRTTSTARKVGTAKGFDAGKIGRRLRAVPTTGAAINTQIRRYGRNVVARSRYLCANNPYASSAKEEFIAYMVGTGITPSSLVKDTKLKATIQEAFLLWTDEADADSITDFYGLQALIAAEMFEAGECFVRLRPRFLSDGFTVPLQLQLLPTEMLDTGYNVALANGSRIECGIQFDAIGRREGYHFFTQHPGEQNFTLPLNPRYRTFVAASEVMHLYRPMRAGQIRGIPMTLSGMITLAMLDLYDDAELERKRLAALFGAFITQGLGATDDDDASPLAGAPTSAHDNSNTGAVDVAMEPGATVTLEYGQDVKFAEPADVGGNYEAFQKRQLLKGSAGFLSTYHGMTGDTGGASFSSMRADQLRYKRRIEPMQHHILVFQFCRRVWNAWMDAAVGAGAIDGLKAAEYTATPNAFKACKWTPPKWDWVDPLKDITAEKLAVDAGFKARQDVVSAQGEDVEAVDERIKQDQERAGLKGLKFMTLSTTIVVSPSSELEAEPAPAPGAVDPKNPNGPPPAKVPAKQKVPANE
jgi:lambda family phage portal protein